MTMKWFKGRSRSSRNRSGTPSSEYGACFACEQIQLGSRGLVTRGGLSICDGCLEIADAIHRDSSAARITRLRAIADGRACSFCEKEVPVVTAGGNVGICLECLDLCREMQAQDPSLDLTYD